MLPFMDVKHALSASQVSLCLLGAISRDRAFYVIASYPESDVLTCSWYVEDDRG